MSGFIAPPGPAYPVTGGFGVGAGATARHYLEGTADPSAGAGIAAPIGSLYSRNNAGVGETWNKTGAAAAAWAIVGAGGGSTYHGAIMNDLNEPGGNQPIGLASNAYVTMSNVVKDTDGFITAPGVFTIPAATGWGIYRYTLIGGYQNGSGYATMGTVEAEVELNMSGPWVGGPGHAVPFDVFVVESSAMGAPVHLTLELDMQPGDTLQPRVFNGTDAANFSVVHGGPANVVWSASIALVVPLP